MIELMKKALRAVEWTGRDGDYRPVCPICRQGKRKGHKPDCVVGQALAAEGDCLSATLAEIEKKVAIVDSVLRADGKYRCCILDEDISPYWTEFTADTRVDAAAKALKWIKEVQTKNVLEERRDEG